jgi:predicted nucleic acid-binding protein
MAGPVFVPDASVILKWVLRDPTEEGRAPALELKSAWIDGALELVVPTLWLFEVGNVLGLKQPARAEGLLDAVIELSLPEEPAAAYAGRIFELMRERRVTFYDAAYHALAIARGGIMLTADRRYVSECGGAGHVQLIGDWQPPAARPAGR